MSNPHRDIRCKKQVLEYAKQVGNVRKTCRSVDLSVDHVRRTLHMTRPTPLPRVWRFGAFELDLHHGELLRHGVKVPLQEQPLKLLVLLVERADDLVDLVTREMIAAHLWPDAVAMTKVTCR